MKKLIIILILTMASVSLFAQPQGSTKVNNLKIYGEIIPIPETINTAPDYVVTQDSLNKVTTYTEVSEVVNLSWSDVGDSLSVHVVYDSLNTNKIIVGDSAATHMASGDTVATIKYVIENSAVITGNLNEILISNGNGSSITSSNFRFNDGIYSTSVNGYGLNASADAQPGIFSTSASSSGVRGISTSLYGVWGSSTTSYGVYGTSPDVIAVYGSASAGGYGIYGKSATGVSGYFTNNTGNTSNIIEARLNTSLKFAVNKDGALLMAETTDEPYGEGKYFYDSETKAMTVFNDLPDFTHQLGYELAARYYNNTGETIYSGDLLTPVGSKINGVILPTVQFAGNGSIDSLQLVAMSTTTTLDGEYGAVTTQGPVNGLDLSIMNNNDFVYVGHNRKITNVSPSPPELSMLVGKVFYADNDSGQLYMWPGEFHYDPAPIISGDSSRYNTVLTINAIGQFEYIPISVFQVENAFGFSKVGDSIQVLQEGFVTIALNNSYTGNAQSDIWRQGIFVNGSEVFSNARSTTSTSVGNQTTIKTIRLMKDDWVSFRMANLSAVRDPTLNDMSYEIIYLHR